MKDERAGNQPVRLPSWGALIIPQVYLGTVLLPADFSCQGKEP